MDYWDDIVARGEDAIRDLCAARAAEGQHLEFKRKSSPERGGLNKDDKKSLGESLSAMSNAEGGIAIFGIVDEKIDGVDYAKDVELIEDVAAFARNIKCLIPNYLSPPNPDIEVRPIPFAQDREVGVVAVRIGQSENRPHQSLAPDHHRYYQRVDAVNLRMVDFQVRDMLRINTAPRLRVGYQLISKGRGGNQQEVHCDSQLVLTLKNEGRVTARQPYILVLPGTNLHLVDVGTQKFQRLFADDGREFIQGTNDIVIHPGLGVPVAAFLAQIKHISGDVHYRLDARTRDYIRFDECPPVQFKVAVGAENTPARNVEFSLGQDELEIMAERLIHNRQPFYGNEWF